MQISKDKVVTIDYTLKDDVGDVIDSSQDQAPLAYIHGVGAIIPGLEQALEGKSAGDRIEVTIPPAEAYGERDDSLCQEVPRKEFEGIDELEVGMQFRVEAESGYLVLTVVNIGEDVVTVDGNHALAGETLHFDVEVREVRDATEQELEHGHIHGGVGCDHGGGDCDHGGCGHEH
jgi:FKBP-type peptidyl-prolyl cis-trans isomerase SlyD